MSWLLAATALPVGAVTLDYLYEADQPVLNDAREAAFVDALKTVVVRVSGQRDAPARLGSALNDPRKYVQRFGFTADNVLQVGFDSVSVDRLLQEAGLPIWGRERPATLVLLNVTEPNGYTHWISGDQPNVQRDILDKVARERGLPLKWPAVDPQGIDESNALQEADRYGANAALVGRAQGGMVRWTLVTVEGSSQTSGGMEQGVHLAADTFARVFAASGSSLGNVVVEVSGIGDLDAYASTLNYLEGMTLVRAVSLEQVSGDTMRFKLAVRGDASTLRRAIALDSRLVSQDDAAAPGAERLTFRYRP
ncbi:DUF2066 domain-containing protein [Steroidobacter sp. S1-65]|uniref:DUF2066 domain-containing protein n=1 Tax=Steroidobacter gossypii TaxID=2805490 RepID=A0ABS1X664_9GAMM|nr:DUF2066 domain-containing protein [Steroidobacter gossypii]MBM0108719.1 DUF2066 domain-containing protein [Steroidobacter gossypii]